ncbi:hypothetical protein FB567DRAFT_480974 [Paraphoma chrysanthemicola]|uniref:Uncharacterized protein n=1 Tax=Paraphoma chrysanthemicola TaxID=798071 RepID=A0A8K0VTS4_9PLEO|nr:hypothetical protein FB567DRAFT_480974 [Paraphoma chrysanthemicola]
MASLGLPLNKDVINDVTRHSIVDALWPSPTNSTIEQQYLELEPYFDYYIRQCHNALVDGGHHVLTRTHQDIVDIARHIESNGTRDSIKVHLKSKFTTPNRPEEDSILNNTIDLAARLHLMVNVRSTRSFISGQMQLNWTNGGLKDCVSEHFKESRVLGSDGIRLDTLFTAANLERIAGIRVRFTDNLADHLRLIDKDDKIVAVFHHASFLHRQTSTVLPTGLKEETIRTLALLFPQHDRSTRKWLNKQSTKFDGMLLRCDPLRLEDRQVETFHFWHDRLVMLKQAFDQSRPATMSQWWFDRRNGVQWYTFWVAVLVLVLTIFFGMVQSIEGALQVYKAYHPS